MAVREERDEIKSWHLARGEDNIVSFIILILLLQKIYSKKGKGTGRTCKPVSYLAVSIAKVCFFLQPWSSLKTKSWL